MKINIVNKVLVVGVWDVPLDGELPSPQMWTVLKCVIGEPVS